MSSEVTQLLNAIETGDAHAADDLLPLAYKELRRMAQSMMQRILIENARKKARQKRGSNVQHLPFDENCLHLDEPSEQLLALNHALDRLEEVDQLLAKIVKLRYFAGLKAREVAAALNTSESTINRGWKAARAWLFREISEHSDTI